MRFKHERKPSVEWKSIDDAAEEMPSACVFQYSENCARPPTHYKIYNIDVLVFTLSEKKAYCDFHRQNDRDFQYENRGFTVSRRSSE